jgi:metallo-beta-lactamase family protein
MDIQFIGATGTVTGSKYLISSGSKCVLVDCGLFQRDEQSTYLYCLLFLFLF